MRYSCKACTPACVDNRPPLPSPLSTRIQTRSGGKVRLQDGKPLLMSGQRWRRGASHPADTFANYKGGQEAENSSVAAVASRQDLSSSAFLKTFALAKPPCASGWTAAALLASAANSTDYPSQGPIKTSQRHDKKLMMREKNRKINLG